MSNEVTSVLRMEKLYFDKILFERENIKNDNKPNYQFEAGISKRSEENLYKVELTVNVDKEKEYRISITVCGLFSFSEKLSERLEDTLLTKNAVAILMPYLRSELSLLTAQPNVDCIVLPPFNINNLLDEN